MEPKEEQESSQQVIASLKELLIKQGWNMLAARLEVHLKQKELVKAEAIRQAKDSDVKLIQGFIDGIQYVLKEPERIISRLKESENVGE